MDNFFGPSRFTRFFFGGEAPGGWRGDHTFNAGAAGYSFEHFLEPEVQKNLLSGPGNRYGMKRRDVWSFG